MAHGGHIHHENYEFIGVKGPAPMPVYSHDPNLHNGNMGPVAHGGHTFRTTPGGSIPEFTYMGSQYPPSSAVMAKSST